MEKTLYTIKKAQDLQFGIKNPDRDFITENDIMSVIYEFGGETVAEFDNKDSAMEAFDSFKGNASAVIDAGGHTLWLTVIYIECNTYEYDVEDGEDFDRIASWMYGDIVDCAIAEHKNIA